MLPLAQVVGDDEAPALAAYVRLLSPGYETYEHLCAGCHGEEGTGSGSQGSRRAVAFDRAFMAAHDAAALRKGVWHMLADEHPAMPHFRGALSEADARAVVGFLKDEQRPR
jgi:mono/diheme cytochrome c family protein